jgi:hypothetical protein
LFEDIKKARNSKKEDLYQNFLILIACFNPLKKRSYRKLLLHHIFSLSQGWSEGVGDWSRHIYAWLRFIGKNIDTNFAIVSYENLLKEPFVILTSLINKLGVPVPSEENVLKAIERQSFENQKNYFQHLDNDQEIPMGKNFNLRFLRKGISGDWKNYYTKEIGRITDKYHGEMLRKLGYVREEKWYLSL